MTIDELRSLNALAIRGKLPELSDDELSALEDAEVAHPEPTRISVLHAIHHERRERAWIASGAIPHRGGVPRG